MDDPGWAWPAWKFGMKREDLFSSLHDQYNTITSTIQDPEAFHHDVFEISHRAHSTNEFHRMMADRKAQRLHELNLSLESAAIEIIANPKLIGTEQWQYALQLFRTKSLDSLVRYFSSYLPEGDNINHRYDTPPSSGSSFAETCSVSTASTKPSTIDDLDDTPFFIDSEDKPVFTHEPIDISLPLAPAITPATVELPPSPRSMSMRSTASVSPLPDNIETHDYAFARATPARSLSFSGSESDHFTPAGRECHHHTDDDVLETSQSDFDTPITSESDLAESRSSLESVAVSEPEPAVIDLTEDDDVPVADDEIPPTQLPIDLCDDFELETPTPRQEMHGASYLDYKVLHRAHQTHRASSPRSLRPRRHDGSPLPGARRSPDEGLSRVQKPLPDATRTRPKGRRRVE